MIKTNMMIVITVIRMILDNNVMATNDFQAIALDEKLGFQQSIRLAIHSG